MFSVQNPAASREHQFLYERPLPVIYRRILELWPRDDPGDRRTAVPRRNSVGLRTVQKLLERLESKICVTRDRSYAKTLMETVDFLSEEA